MYTIKVNDGKEQRDNLKRYLNRKGISTKVSFDPVHLAQLYRKKFVYKGGELPMIEKISRQILTLPMDLTLGEDEINYIVESSETFLLKKD